MRRKPEKNRSSTTSDDADYAAGGGNIPLIGKSPDSRGALSLVSTSSDIEFYEDLISDPVLVLGMDITHLSRNGQFIICASGVFFFQSIIWVSSRTLISSTLQSTAWPLPGDGTVHRLHLPCLYITKLCIPKTKSGESNIIEFKLKLGSLCKSSGAFQALSWIISTACC